MTHVKQAADSVYDSSTDGYSLRTTIPQDPSSNTLLTYAALVMPDPLQVSGPGTITLMASNSTRQAVTVTSISVALPVGVNAKDLTPNATGIEVRSPDNWQSTIVGGVLTFTPETPGAGTITSAGLTFIIADFMVNAQPGTCTVTITENASSPSQPAQTRNATLEVPKFPTQFQVSDLQAYPLEVAAGGATTLTWIGSAGATYTLDYQPANQGTPVAQTVSNAGPYVSQILTRTGSVTFTLVVKLVVPGQDQPLTVQRQTVVTVDTLSLSLTGAPLTVGANGLTHLEWTSANATSCTLDPGGIPVPTSGERYVLVPITRVFTLTAYGFGGMVQQQLTIMVDPAIQPNIQGYSITGPAGGRGHDSQSGPGEEGGAGGDAMLTVALPPLDVSSSPTRVIPITLIGGAGGDGGNGGSTWGSKGGNAGNGGRGGNATLTATLDASVGAPAQFMITMAPGVGGAPGLPGHGGGTGNPGSQGPKGANTMTFGGVP